MDTGMRLGETLSLVIDAIDLDRRVILIPADITKVKKRYVFFGNTTSGILRRGFSLKIDILIMIFWCCQQLEEQN